MTLITLLLVLTIERVAAKTSAWQFSFYYQKYHLFWLKHGADATGWMQQVWRFGYFLFPALLVLFIRYQVDWLLLQVFLDILVLLVCIGCADIRKIYKRFLNSVNRGDEQARHLYATQLLKLQGSSDNDVHAKMNDSPLDGPPPEESILPTTQQDGHVGLALVWINFRCYAAVLFWFVCFGAAGAVIYCLFRDSYGDEQQKQVIESNYLGICLHVLDWLPARFCSAGYLFIGSFTCSSGIWLGYLLDFKSPAKSLISDIAGAAEPVNIFNTKQHFAPALMLKLAKRNVLFFLTMVAILTLNGVVA